MQEEDHGQQETPIFRQRNQSAVPACIPKCMYKQWFHWLSGKHGTT